MSNNRTATALAIEALKDLVAHFGEQHSGEFSEIECVLCDAIAKGRAAIAALEAETGEPVAWIDPRDLAVLTCPGVKEFGPMRYAGVSGAQNSKSTLPLYTAPPPAVPPGWKPVPIEPTEAMWKAGLGHMYRDVDSVWRAMLAAAPGVPS